jgi:hypothetical protein
MDANCNVLPTSAGATGCTLDATMATIITISMADTNNNNNRRKQQQKNTATMTRAPSITCTTIAGQAAN